MENLKIARNVVTKIPNAETFVRECHDSLHKVMDGAPYDGSVSLSAEFDGQFFKTTIKLVSSSLRFSIVRAARSPFVALEGVIKDALAKIDIWSALKNKTLGLHKED